MKLNCTDSRKQTSTANTVESKVWRADAFNFQLRPADYCRSTFIARSIRVFNARSRERTNREKGQSLIEVTVGIVVLIPAILVLIDLAVIVIGVEMNDAACRNAARAAAAGEPSDAESRARSVINRLNNGAHGAMVSNFNLVPPVDVRITSQPPKTDSDGYQGPGEAGGEETMIDGAMEEEEDIGGAVTGSTTVMTQVDIRPFVVQVFCGGQSPITVHSRQTFPISYLRPGKRDSEKSTPVISAGTN